MLAREAINSLEMIIHCLSYVILLCVVFVKGMNKIIEQVRHFSLVEADICQLVCLCHSR